MNTRPTIKRRGFVTLCASTLAAVSASPKLLAQTGAAFNAHQRVQLVDELGEPFKASSLETGKSYLFHYPYVCTPCFLLDLGRPTAAEAVLNTADHREYHWRGGVGPRRSLVAFSAICAHRMSHPARSVSFINYRHHKVRFLSKDSKISSRSGVIFCCSEKSVYDPAEGARVLGGPAPQPLAAIVLEHDEQHDTLHATGTYGGEMFQQFFEKFGHRLVLEYRTDAIRALVSESSTVVPLTRYCARQVLCSA